METNYKLKLRKAPILGLFSHILQAIISIAILVFAILSQNHVFMIIFYISNLNHIFIFAHFNYIWKFVYFDDEKIWINSNKECLVWKWENAVACTLRKRKLLKFLPPMIDIKVKPAIGILTFEMSRKRYKKLLEIYPNEAFKEMIVKAFEKII